LQLAAEPIQPLVGRVDLAAHAPQPALPGRADPLQRLADLPPAHGRKPHGERFSAIPVLPR